MATEVASAGVGTVFSSLATMGADGGAPPDVPSETLAASNAVAPVLTFFDLGAITVCNSA